MGLKLFNFCMTVWVKRKNVWTILTGLIGSLDSFYCLLKEVIIASAAPKKGDSPYPLTRDEKWI